MKRIGVVLSGCGVYDGAEIQESVLTLLAIDRAGAEAVCVAPDIEQAEVVNHLTGKSVPGSARNVLQEAARIARGNIRSVATVKVAELDAVIFPGGYGAVKNLSDFAFAPERPLRIDPSIAKLVEEAFVAKKPLGFICISPLIAAGVLGKQGITLTIGNDRAAATAIVNMGAKHVEKPVSEIHRDPTYPIVSTPAYMLGERISEVAAGIEKLVHEVLKLIPA